MLMKLKNMDDMDEKYKVTNETIVETISNFRDNVDILLHPIEIDVKICF